MIFHNHLPVCVSKGHYVFKMDKSPEGYFFYMVQYTVKQKETFLSHIKAYYHFYVSYVNSFVSNKARVAVEPEH